MLDWSLALERLHEGFRNIFLITSLYPGSRPVRSIRTAWSMVAPRIVFDYRRLQDA